MINFFEWIRREPWNRSSERERVATGAVGAERHRTEQQTQPGSHSPNGGEAALSFLVVGQANPIQQRCPEMTIHALDKGIVPGTTGRDRARLPLTLFKPILNSVGHKLRAMIAAEVDGRSPC